MWATSTHFTDSYGGISLPPEAMEKIATAIKDGKIPFATNHDALQQWKQPTILISEVRKVDDEHIGVWVEIEVDEDEADKIASFGGVSVTLIADPFEPDLSTGKPSIAFSVDAGEFDRELYFATVEELKECFAVGGGLLLQFATLPPAKVALSFAFDTLKSIPGNLISSVLFEKLKRFLKPKHSPESIFEFKVTAGERSSYCKLKTSNEELLREAMSTFQTAVVNNGGAGNLLFNPQSNKWEPASIRPSQEIVIPTRSASGRNRQAHHPNNRASNNKPKNNRGKKKKQ